MDLSKMLKYKIANKRIESVASQNISDLYFVNLIQVLSLISEEQYYCDDCSSMTLNREEQTMMTN